MKRLLLDGNETYLWCLMQLQSPYLSSLHLRHKQEQHLLHNFQKSWNYLECIHVNILRLQGLQGFERDNTFLFNIHTQYQQVVVIQGAKVNTFLSSIGRNSKNSKRIYKTGLIHFAEFIKNERRCLLKNIFYHTQLSHSCSIFV